MNIAVDDLNPALVERDAERARQQRKRRLIVAGSGLALVALAGVGLYWYSEGRYLEQTDDAYVRADWVPISARVGGYVAEVVVQDDQPVKAGDLLVRLDERDYRTRLEQAGAARAEADAALTAAQAQVQISHALITQQQAGIAQAGAQLQSARAELQRASLDQQRYQGLVRDHAASAQRLETAQAGLAQAKAAVDSAVALQRQQDSRLAVIRSREQLAQAALEQQRARQAEARAQWALANNALQDTQVRAPIDGVVGQRKVRTRQYITPGQPLLAVVPVQQAYVVANFKETQLAEMRPGQSVDISVDSFAGHERRGHIASFSPGSGAVFALLPSDNATGNFTKIVQRFPVRILLDPAPGQPPLLPGMSVTATVDTRAEHANER
ncbi:MAG: HlyD family secretion protein [Pseudomonas sp.]|nr:HlyD family secretion protein [Pseudomonas sp.]